MMTVAVVINTYNHERFIESCIKSASMNHPNELIVVNDGSTDKTALICDRLAQDIPGVRLIHKANGGQVSAIRKGLERVTSDVVIFLDGDDMLNHDAVATVRRLWRPGVSKIQWCMKVVDTDGKLTGKVFPKFPDDLNPRADLIVHGAYTDSPTSANAYRTYMVRQFINELDDGFDGEMNGVAAMMGVVVTIRDQLTLYRVHENNDFAMKHLDRSRFAEYCKGSERRLEWLRQRFPELQNTTLDLDTKYQEWRLAAGLTWTPFDLIKAVWASPFGYKRKLLTIAWSLMAATRMDWPLKVRFTA